MDVSTAVDVRISCRAFLDTPVPDETIRELLTKASRAPSGGNVQPWKIFVVNGSTMDRFQDYLAGKDIEEPGYDVYPSGLWEPHRTARYQLGEQMYELLGIGRDDKAGRIARMMDNYRFFGAPAAFFCFLDRRMGPPQWSDCGMFLQTFMLLAVEAGLATCAQEIWCSRSQAVADFVGAPNELILFCGMAIGHMDADHPVNALRSDRLALDLFAQWV
ncbi:MAG: nitroreductase [Acidimicrobiia bacterium]|nr:nitroreductase [Acidimicrobiia bacterium]